MEYRDYYKTLGVARDASAEDIKRAYRKLARKYHPDVSDEEDAEQRFKEVGEAYEVLKDPEKRQAYDQLGQGPKPGEGFRPPPGWDRGFEFRSEGHGGVDPADFSDFFADLFGGGGRSQRRPPERRGEDHHASVQVDLADSYQGAARNITLNAPELDDEGYVVQRQRTLQVRIPKGVTEGQQIRLKGQGGPGLGNAPAGDLLLEIRFRPQEGIRAEGTDVYLDLPVAPWEAALGGEVTLTYPGGKLDLKIPPDSRQGSKLRLRGRGLPARQPGDLYVVLQLVMPSSGTTESRKAWENLRDVSNFNPRQGKG